MDWLNILLDALTVVYSDVRNVKDIALSYLANEGSGAKSPFLEFPAEAMVGIFYGSAEQSSI